MTKIILYKIGRSAFRGLPKKLVWVGTILILFLVGVTLLAPFLTTYSHTGTKPDGSFFKPFQPPNQEHLMGTNDIGQDVYTRVLYGGRIPLMVAIFSTFFAILAGVPLGLISGYVGGIPDRVMSLLMDSLFAFPGLILAIAITAMLGPSIMNTAAAITVIYVPVFFRMVRSQVLSIKELMYIDAAKAIGERTWSIILRYIFPNVLPTISVVITMCFADAILIEAGLAFIGLSTAVPPEPSWGFDLVVGKRTLLGGYWWIVTFPGLMIVLAALGFSLLGEGLSELTNPKLAE